VTTVTAVTRKLLKPDPSVFVHFWNVAFVRKNTAHKESSREKSHVHRAKFNGRLQLPGWPGKDGAAVNPGQAWLL
jgi:hypothetical protein